MQKVDDFLAVILCDPPITEIFEQTGVPNRDYSIGSKYSEWQPISPTSRTAQNTPFSNGYPDFIKHPEFGKNVHIPEGPPRTSMLEDLCFYWNEYGAYLVKNSSPATATVFVQKVVVSNYMQLIEFVRANISNLEYQLSRRNTLADIRINWVEERWSDLQAWSRRCSEYIEDVESIMIGLGISSSASAVTDSKITDWRNCDRDFQYIYHRLKALKARVDVLNNSITGLAGIIGNQQALLEAKRSLKEAKGIKTLTLLGMVFIPLAFSTGLFSMNDRYLPGAASFWIYPAISIPLLVIVFSAASLIELGYNNEGDWKWNTFFQATYRRPGTLSIVRNKS
jgi:CorA-like Mg2+ transporter protein